MGRIQPLGDDAPHPLPPVGVPVGRVDADAPPAGPDLVETVSAYTKDKLIQLNEFRDNAELAWSDPMVRKSLFYLFVAFIALLLFGVFLWRLRRFARSRPSLAEFLGLQQSMFKKSE